MDAIARQVGRAQRRLILEQFLQITVWTLFAALLLAAVGLAIPKIWPLSLDHQAWMWGWIGGALGVGLLTALVWTLVVRRSRLEAAIELDRRFGLKERVSSVLALHEAELHTEIGQALMQDAVRKVERCEVGERFRIQPTWRLALPLAPAAAVVGLVFVPNATLPKPAGASPASSPEIKLAVQKATEKLRQKLNAEKKSEDPNLKDAEALLKQIDKLNELAGKDKVEQTQISLKINDLAKDIEKRKAEAGSAKDLQKQLGKLDKIQNGPAEKLANSLKEGDFAKAQEQLKDLVEKLQAGKLDEQEKKELAQQLNQIKEKLQQLAEDRKDAKDALEQKLQQALEQGELAEASKLQQQLDKMGLKGPLDEMMKKLGDKMGECAKCMQGGDGKQGEKGEQEAADKLGDIAKDLQQLQEQLQQAEQLDELLDDLAEAKDAICKQCQGGDGKAGMKAGQGKDGFSKMQGQGMGKGQGSGDRPETETDTGFYESKVAGDVQKGQSSRIGDAGGRNQAGKTLAEVKQSLEAALKKDPDSLEEVTLPRELRNQAKEYFEKLRKGE